VTDTVFWSWQSDLDTRVTRDVVRDALAGALADLEAELEERPELTSDTKGVPGSPDIVATILDKIDACAVFVGDVTPIAFSKTGKAVANPNVLIELGYAKKSRGLNRLLLVWNTAFEGTTPEQLPFDMRARRAPLGFHLPVGASRDELRAQREVLREALKDALRASLAAGRPQMTLAVPQWQPPSEQTPALWFDPSQPLQINDSGVTGRKPISPGPYSYVRIVPTHWDRPGDFGVGQGPSILGRTMGYSWGTTKGGLVRYTGSVRSGRTESLANMTIQFRGTGELWGVDPFVSGRGYFWSDYVINSFNSFIAANLSYLASQGARGPFHVRLGVTDLLGLKWSTQTHWGGQPEALEPQVETDFIISTDEEGERLTKLEQAWGEIAAAFGIPPPDRNTFLDKILLVYG
jgi:hypothetical protein